MTADRPGCDRDHAEPVAAGERCQDRTFGDAENRTAGRLAAYVQARIAVTGNDEGGGRDVVLDDPPEGQDDLLGILLALDAERTLGEGLATDARPPRETQRPTRRVKGSGNLRIRVRVDDENVRGGHAAPPL